MPANSLIDQTIRTAAGAVRLPFRVGDRAARQTIGLMQRVVRSHPAPKPDIDGVTLARKVESEVFRGRGAPKDRVDVNAVDGVVYLHGEVRRAQDVRDIERRVRAVPEVRDVENLLHTRKTPARSRADAPGRQKARATSRRRSRPRREPRRLAADKRPPKAEPEPDVLAAQGRGRQPAPMGSQDEPQPPAAGGHDEPQSASPAGQDEPTPVSSQDEPRPAAGGREEPQPAPPAGQGEPTGASSHDEPQTPAAAGQHEPQPAPARGDQEPEPMSVGGDGESNSSGG